MKRLAAVSSLFAAVAMYCFLPASCGEPAKRTAAIFIMAAIFWGFEIIPLYATSILVVLAQTFFLTKAGGIFGISQNSFTIFLNPFANPVIILFFGGFILAAAVHKHGLDRMIAFRLLRWFGTKPYFVLLGFMTATAFLSLWMSNTATTALMLVMIQPLLSDLEKDDQFRKALVLAIAFAANIGGIGTPVGTPPNAIAIGILAERGIQVNFLSWMMMAVPLAAILIFTTSFILYGIFPPKARQMSLNFSKAQNWTAKSCGVAVIAVLTLSLWLTSPWHRIPESIVALFAVALLTSFSFLDGNDVKGIDWDILILMWGGLALGEGMEISGLAKWVVGLPLFSHQGFMLLAILCVLTVFLSTFMSNTATVNLLVPIAVNLPGANPIMLATIVALASSFDIALPISTPPMAMAYGSREITVADMLKAGIIFTVIANVLLLFGFQFFMARIFGLT